MGGAIAPSRKRKPLRLKGTKNLPKGSACFVCGSKKNLERHHINPRSNGGKATPKNIIPLCAKCHDRLEGANWPEIYALKKQYSIDAATARSKVLSSQSRYTNQIGHIIEYDPCEHTWKRYIPKPGALYIEPFELRVSEKLTAI